MNSDTAPREPARSGDEYDVIGGHWRRYYCWTQRSGATSKVKRGLRRRERRAEREMLRLADEFFDALDRGEDVLGDAIPVGELLRRLGRYTDDAG